MKYFCNTTKFSGFISSALTLDAPYKSQSNPSAFRELLESSWLNNKFSIPGW
jgi:hypothetical protein